MACGLSLAGPNFLSATFSFCHHTTCLILHHLAAHLVMTCMTYMKHDLTVFLFSWGFTFFFLMSLFSRDGCLPALRAVQMVSRHGHILGIMDADAYCMVHASKKRSTITPFPLVLFLLGRVGKGPYGFIGVS